MNKNKLLAIPIVLITSSFFCQSSSYAYYGNVDLRILTAEQGYMVGGSFSGTDGIPASLIAGLQLFHDGVYMGEHQVQTIGQKTAEDEIERKRHPAQGEYFMKTWHNFYYRAGDERSEYRTGSTTWK
ncbi:hypothetical protein [Paenibacillus chitinolyticus]|uniref:hypothetical protein n=1 Tax=Paenibacillus chitinolyticus TaxID=79263 RepID=UPI003662169B